MGPTGDARVVQIHPTRRCNLRCLHCYSSSGPEARGELPAALLVDAIDDAGAAGYNVVAFSGGEPTLYGPLRSLLERARRRGMTTSVTTNGTLLDDRRMAMLAGAADLLAISLDGVPASHDRMRARDGAFARMAACLDRVRASGIPFGFIFTLTQYNLHELGWVLEFALGQGAKLLQIHPLEEAGRAGELLPGERPDAIEAAFAAVAVAQMREVAGDRLLVQLDLANRDQLRDRPERVLAREPEPGGAEPATAELLSPLVIEDDGTVVPLQYGFPRRYALGNLGEARLGDLLARWRRDDRPAFLRLCRETFEELSAPAELPMTNWYELIARRARS